MIVKKRILAEVILTYDDVGSVGDQEEHHLIVQSVETHINNIGAIKTGPFGKIPLTGIRLHLLEEV